MSYEAFLPNKKATASVKGIMVRPDKELCDFLTETATKHGCSVNQLVVAFIKEAFERTKQRYREGEEK